MPSSASASFARRGNGLKLTILHHTQGIVDLWHPLIEKAMTDIAPEVPETFS
jgi:hypothetical protein